MSTVAGLLEEIEKRRKAVAALEGEILTLQRSVDILEGRPKAEGPPTPKAPSVHSATLVAISQALALGTEVTQAPIWQQKAQEILADGGTHELKDLALAATIATPGANLERVRKSLHVWLTRRVEKGEVVKLERGEYRLLVTPRTA